jgi:hypothetical protein
MNILDFLAAITRFEAFKPFKAITLMKYQALQFHHQLNQHCNGTY